MRIHWLLLGIIACSAPAAGLSIDTVVTKDTTWTADHVIPHDLIISRNATLTLVGVDLRIGNQLQVDAGSTLRLLHGSSGATTLRGLDDSSNATHGYWIQVNGTLETDGADLQGMRGRDLSDLYDGDGGLRIVGQANLTHLHIHHSAGTLVVPKGRANLQDSIIEGTGLMGVASHGQLIVSNTQIQNVSFALMCHSPGRLVVTSSQLDGLSEGLMVNGCRAQVSDSIITGKATGIYEAGAADLSLRGTLVQGYTQRGIFAQALPKDAGGYVSPVLRLNGTQVRALDQVNTTGIYLQGAEAHIRKGFLQGNLDGMLAKDNALLDLNESRIINNARYGIYAFSARYAGDLMRGNDLGSWAQGTANGRKDLVATTTFHASMVDDYQRLLPNVTVRIFAAGTLLGSATGDQGATISFALYRADAFGSSHFLGPFTYEVRQAGTLRGQGPVDLANPAIVIQSQAHHAIGVALLPLAFLVLAGAARRR